MIRKLAAGIYTWSPLGLRVLTKVANVVREEMNRAGALELLMPSIQPKELWEETGRWEKFGGQLLKIKDRKEASYCYGPTHEEVITDYARNELKSYKQLPVNFYQIQTKFRDEIRPRFGVMRAREFLMASALFWRAYRAWVQPDIPPGGVDVFGCTRAFRDDLLALGEANSSLIGQLFWLGQRRVVVPYERLARKHGRSAWSFSRKLKYLMRRGASGSPASSRSTTPPASPRSTSRGGRSRRSNAWNAGLRRATGACAYSSTAAGPARPGWHGDANT